MEPRSPSAERARRRARAGQRRVITATLISVTAALGVLWVARPTEPGPPPPQSEVVPTSGPQALGAGPESDADLVLVWGEPTGALDRSRLPSDGPFSLDLRLPVPIDEGTEWLAVKIFRDRKDPFDLEGRVRGVDRDRVRLDIPTERLGPGSYLINVRTTESSHFPFRRFVLLIESAEASATPP